MVIAHQRTKKQVEQWLAKHVAQRMSWAGIGQPLYVAGGAIASLLLGEEPNDIDLWAMTKEIAFAAAEDVRESGTLECETKWAVTTKNKIQVITGLFGSPREVTEKFDFEHAKAWWTSSDGLQITAEQEELARTRTVRYTHSDYPFASLMRAAKLLRRGWVAGDGEIMLIALDIWRCVEVAHVARSILGIDLALDDGVRRALEDAKTIEDVARAIELMRR